MNPFNNMTKSQRYFFETKITKPAYDFSKAETKESIYSVERMICKLARQYLEVVDAEQQVNLARQNAKLRASEIGVFI